MSGKHNLQDLIRDANIHPISARQPALPAPSQPVITASEEDHALARRLLIEQRVSGPDYRDPGKQLKRIFRSSKEKEKLEDTSQWEFTQDEIDRALLAVIDKPATSSALVQAFLDFGAKVNYIEVTDGKGKANKKPVVIDRRRSSVLQRAATVRRADSLNLLAASGADQTTLDEGLKAALSASNQPCIRELLRHGADLNKCPNALADAVRSNDQNFINLLLRAPKALRPDIISSCLPAAVQQASEPTISLLIAHGADPNFDNASALATSISRREYRLAVALVAGSIPLTSQSLQVALSQVLAIQDAQDLHRFVQLLLCCGLNPASSNLGGVLIAACQRNDTRMAEMLISHGVPTGLEEAKCLREAILRSNFHLADAILATAIVPAHASAALDIVPVDASKPDRLHVVSALVSKGANGRSLERWLVRAVEDGDSQLMDLLLNAGAPLAEGNNNAVQAAVARKDTRSLRSLLASRPSPRSLAQVFPLIRSGYTAPERLETVRLLLEHGARGSEVDQALVDAIADTSSSRDVALITELIRHGANVNYDDGQVFKVVISQADVVTLRLLCEAKPSRSSRSAAVPLIFHSNGSRSSSAASLLELLLGGGVEEAPAMQTLQLAISGGSDNLDIVERLIAVDARLVGHAFECVVSLSNSRHKEKFLELLLSKGISQEKLDQALVAESRQLMETNNEAVIQLLLNYGASIHYNDGEAFINTTATGDDALVKLMLSGKHWPTKAISTSAFRSLFDIANLRRVRITVTSSNDTGSSQRPADILNIANDLLARKVDQSAIDIALQAVLDPANGLTEIEPIVDCLVSHRANVNAANGICFTSAARRNVLLFTKLLSYQPNYTTLVPTLLGDNLDETTLLPLVEACFTHGCTADDLDLSNPPTLTMAVQQYPRSEALTKLLLTQGCNPDASISAIIDSTVGEEVFTVLLWALAQPQKMVSSAVILALLQAGASATRVAPRSEIAPIALAAREGRPDIIKALLEHGADASFRDKRDRSALFYASSSPVSSVVEALAPYALPNDGSLHEAARTLQLDAVALLIKSGHSPGFPSRLHEGRNALGEFCLMSELDTGTQLSKARQLIRLLLSNGARAEFKARNERSAVILALDNPNNPLMVAEILLETEVWEQLNDEKHMFRDGKGLWYSPLSFVEHVPSPARAAQKQELIDLLRDKGCEPKYYSETEHQPPGAVGLPTALARLADRQKEHQLSLKLAKESSEHARMLEETAHLDHLRRAKEKQDAALAAAAASAAHTQSIEQRHHEASIHRVREAERMKRAEKAQWHALLSQQEHEAAAQRAQIEERKAGAAYAAENRLIEARKGEVAHRAGVERAALKEKEEFTQRNVKMQMQVQDRVDESARLHAGLKERKQLEWGTVD